MRLRLAVAGAKIVTPSGFSGEAQDPVFGVNLHAQLLQFMFSDANGDLVFLCGALGERIGIKGLNDARMKMMERDVTTVVRLCKNLRQVWQGGVLHGQVSYVGRPKTVAKHILVGWRILTVPRQLDVVATGIPEQTKGLGHADAGQSPLTGAFANVLAGRLIRLSLDAGAPFAVLAPFTAFTVSTAAVAPG